MGSRLTATALEVSGAFELRPEILGDQRGYFFRWFCEKDLSEYFSFKIVQANQSFSKKAHTLRGLHYQYGEFTEAKIVRCSRGKIFDVIVDLREDSPTFLKWVSVELNDSLSNMVYVPKGCAHGFQTLSDDCEIIYLHDNYYSPDHESGIIFNDQKLNIEWPHVPSEMSERDKGFKKIEEGTEGFNI